MMEKMTQSNATVANLLTNFTPTYTMQPVKLLLFRMGSEGETTEIKSDGFDGQEGR